MACRETPLRPISVAIAAEATFAARAIDVDVSYPNTFLGARRHSSRRRGLRRDLSELQYPQ